MGRFTCNTISQTCQNIGIFRLISLKFNEKWKNNLIKFHYSINKKNKKKVKKKEKRINIKRRENVFFLKFNPLIFIINL